MIDISKIKYRLNLLDENGLQYNITDYTENLGWEENERELALRMTFGLQNANTSLGRLSKAAKPGCLVRVTATDGRTLNREVARGFIVDWRPTMYGTKETIQIKAYDLLYYLQRSQDNLFFPKGQGTQDIIKQIFAKWNVPLGVYQGPDVKHEKLLYKSKTISDILAELMDDAVKAGGVKTIIRAEEGKVNIIPWGMNDPIYYFDRNSTMMQDHSKSMAQMVTRVKIFEQTDGDEQYAFEENVDGKTEFGIFQKIHVRDKEQTKEEAITAAQEILKESGDLSETITIQAPDIPFIRKGDLVYAKVGTLKNFFVVSGIRHDADIRKMTLDLKRADEEVLRRFENAVPRQ